MSVSVLSSQCPVLSTAHLLHTSRQVRREMYFLPQPAFRIHTLRTEIHSAYHANFYNTQNPFD